MRSPMVHACSSTTTCWPPEGTAGALCELVTELGGRVVGCAFLIELAALDGRRRLASHPVKTLIRYD